MLAYISLPLVQRKKFETIDTSWSLYYKSFGAHLILHHNKLEC